MELPQILERTKKVPVADLHLHVPARIEPTNDSFDARPKRVEAWISTLPLGNPGETARLVYGALIEMNRLRMSATDRMKILELFRNTIHFIEECLRKHYVGQSLPLSPKNQKLAELSLELMSEMAIGYKIIIMEATADNLKFDAKSMARVIQRAIRYVGRLLLQSYQIYAPYPAGAWRELHQLYLYAEHHNMADIQVRDAEHTRNQVSSASNAYKQNLLLSLACPYRLRQGEADEIYLALEEWVQDSVLYRYDDSPEAKGLFLIDLDSDEPPTYAAREPNKHSSLCRNLDTSGLATVIREEIKFAGKPGTGRGELQKEVMTRDLLRRLMMSWGVMTKRRFSRMSKSSQVAVSVGINAVHYFIGGNFDQINPSTCNQTGEPNFQKPAEFAARGEHSLDTPDLWEINMSMSANPHNRERESANDAGENTFQFHQWDMVNSSAGGYCLLWTKDDVSAAQVGEIVGIRETTKDQTVWTIGVIRWMKYIHAKGLEVGVQMLAPCAEAIATKNKDAQSANEYVRALILPAINAIKQPATLLTPVSSYKIGEEIEIDRGDQKAHMKLTKLVESTGTYAQFQFQLDSPISTKESGAGSDSKIKEFDSIWTSI